MYYYLFSILLILIRYRLFYLMYIKTGNNIVKVIKIDYVETSPTSYCV